MARVLLIHGGAHGAWCFDRLLAPLTDAGHAPEAIDLPGRGADAARAATVTLEDYEKKVASVLYGGDTPVVLVAHSMGGVIGSVIAERHPDAVSRLIFIAALAPQDGEPGLPILLQRGQGSRLLDEGAIVIAEDQKTATIAREAALEGFYSDCDPADAEQAIAQLHAEPMAPMFTPVSLTAANYGRVPKSYVVTTEDRVVPPSLQRELAQAAGAEIHEFTSGHSPFLSEPLALTAALIGPMMDL